MANFILETEPLKRYIAPQDSVDVSWCLAIVVAKSKHVSRAISMY